jgi:ABC-2 type transport system permease protein
VLGSLVAGRAILPGKGSRVPTATSPRRSPTDRRCVRRSVPCSTSRWWHWSAWPSPPSSGTPRVRSPGAPHVALRLPPRRPDRDPEWQERLARYGPTEAGLAIQNTARLDDPPIGPWPGMGVLATYAGVALLSGMTLFQFRDA